MSILFDTWLIADTFVKLYSLQGVDWDGTLAFRRDINTQRTMDPLGYGSIIPRWAVERELHANQTGWGVGKKSVPPTTFVTSRAAMKMNSKTSVLALKVSSTTTGSGQMIGCLDFNTKGVIPYSFRPLSLEGQGGEEPTRKTHSFAVNGCWIDEKYQNMFKDVEVPLYLNLITGGQVLQVSKVNMRSRHLATKPSLRLMLNASSMNIPHLQLNDGDILFFSTTPLKIGNIVVH